MSSITNIDHTFQIITQIPTEHYDPNEVCFLSHKSHEELSSEKQVVRLNCNGIAKYLDLESCLSWVEFTHLENLQCPQCRSLIDLHCISELKTNQLLKKRHILKDKLGRAFEQAKQIELTGSKVQDYILLFSFHKENTFEPLRELARVNKVLTQLKLATIEHQIATIDDPDVELTEEQYQKNTQTLISLLNQREELRIDKQDAVCYYKNLVESQREDTESFEIALKLRHLSNGDLFNQSKTLISIFSASAISVFIFFPLIIPGLVSSIAATHIKSTAPLQELIRRVLYNPETDLPNPTVLETL